MQLNRLPIILALAATLAAGAETRLELGKWAVVNADDNTLDIQYNGRDAFIDAYAEVTYRLGGETETATISSASTRQISAVVADFEDELGTGRSMHRLYNDGTATMTQTINVYDNHPYIVTQVTLKANNPNRTVESNRMIALATATGAQCFDDSNNRMVLVPFDNDGHGRFESYSFPKEMTSHEVGYTYNADSNTGFVAGSIDHDKWKSGITIKGVSNRLDKLQLLSGYTSQLTRDYDWNSNQPIPHGYVKGSEVASARYMLGFFDDWRDGMDSFADACAAIAPPAPWELGSPMGWSTWGVMQNYVNNDATVETVTWIKENLHDLGFHDKQDQQVVSLDSFCDGWGFKGTEISTLGTMILKDGTYRVRENGQWVTKEGLNMRMGMYGGMVIWDWTFDSTVPGTGTGKVPEYKWGDCLLKFNGKEHKLFSGGQYCAIDPTHPAFRANIESTLQRWGAYGCKYIKMDFINAGICEGDSWYDPEITTGVMAYNYGMKVIYEAAQKYDMYIVESMAPMFPYRWAHGRRSCCDRFSELGESEYVMNAMTWGWWTDRLYKVNDPDQLVLHKAGHNHAETEGENRARVTSGMCTGAFIIGDSFSDKCVYTDTKDGHTAGDVVAYPELSKERALKMFGNADINAYVRDNTGSFRPVEVKSITNSQQSGYLFMRDTPDYVYVAAFNWSKWLSRSGSINYSDLGLESTNVKNIKELWTGESVVPGTSSFDYSVPKGDARVYRIEKVTSGVDDVIADRSDAPFITAVIADGRCLVAASGDISGVALYDMSGRLAASVAGVNHVQATLPVNVGKGIYMVSATMADGTRLSAKVLAK